MYSKLGRESAVMLLGTIRITTIFHIMLYNDNKLLPKVLLGGHIPLHFLVSFSLINRIWFNPDLSKRYNYLSWRGYLHENLPLCVKSAPWWYLLIEGYQCSGYKTNSLLQKHGKIEPHFVLCLNIITFNI